MAASVVAGLCTEPASSASPVVIPLQAYAADHDSAEQALPESTEEMQSQPQVRNRLHQGQSGSTSLENEGRSPKLDTTLNSGLEDADEHLRGKEAVGKFNTQL
jgi:hypothetical protein